MSKKIEKLTIEQTQTAIKEKVQGEFISCKMVNYKISVLEGASSMHSYFCKKVWLRIWLF